MSTNFQQVGSGCGSVGRAVASDTIGLRFESSRRQKIIYIWEVVVAQLVEQSLAIPEVCSLTPVIGKILLSICLLSTVLKRRK